MVGRRPAVRLGADKSAKMSAALIETDTLSRLFAAFGVPSIYPGHLLFSPD